MNLSMWSDKYYNNLYIHNFLYLSLKTMSWLGLNLDMEEDFYRSGNNDIDKEITFIHNRSNHGDKYPQGVAKCIEICEQAKRENKTLRVHAIKTFPCWTWIFAICWSINKKFWYLYLEFINFLP